MGGSGGGMGLSPGDLKRLEDAAKQALKKAGAPKKRSVFISFSSEDLDEVNLLRGQAKNEKSDLEFIDRSLRKPFDSKDADYIKRGIRERIRQSSVTICYISNHAANSKWVNWEVEESLRMGKGVIAMFKGKTPPRAIPPAIKANKIKLVPWSHKAIDAAIEGAARGT